MHGHTLSIGATVLLLSSNAITSISASQPDVRFQRRSYRHNENLRMRVRRGDYDGGVGVGRALKPRMTPAPGEPLPMPMPVPEPEVPLEEAPNLHQGINTPDNVAPDTYTEDAGCKAYYAVQDGDICNSILEANVDFGTSLEMFYTMNPSIDEECSNLEPGLAYCLGLGTPANVAPNTLSVESGCTRYQTVKTGDFCLSLVSEHSTTTGLTLDILYQANPMLDSECSNLWLDYSYCVGVTGPVVPLPVEEEEQEEEDPAPVDEGAEEEEEEDCPQRKRRV